VNNDPLPILSHCEYQLTEEEFDKKKFSTVEALCISFLHTRNILEKAEHHFKRL